MVARATSNPRCVQRLKLTSKLSCCNFPSFERYPSPVLWTSSACHIQMVRHRTECDVSQKKLQACTLMPELAPVFVGDMTHVGVGMESIRTNLHRLHGGVHIGTISAPEAVAMHPPALPGHSHPHRPNVPRLFQGMRL